jgi:hypothetical protein
MTAAAVLEDSHEAWKGEALATIIELSYTQPVVTADDLVRELRRPPHTNLPGQAFAAARRLGYIEAIGYQTSTNRTRKHGVLRTWRRRINEGVAL